MILFVCMDYYACMHRTECTLPRFLAPSLPSLPTLWIWTGGRTETRASRVFFLEVSNFYAIS